MNKGKISRTLQREKREALINQYMSELQEILLKAGDHLAWLDKSKGDTYHYGLKLIAEREIYKLMKAKEG